MKKLNLLLIAAAFLLILLVIAGFIISTGSTQDQIATPTPAEIVQEEPMPSPTRVIDETIDLTGRITDIIGPVGYKDSLAIQVGNTNIYVTDETEIVNQENNPISTTAIRQGVTVAIIGTPVEGGIEAQRVIITSTISPTRTASPTPTNSPTPAP